MTGTPSRGATKRSRRRRADSSGGAGRRFPFGIVLRRIRAYLRDGGLADAAMFELAERGHRSVFEQLVGCIISIRTRDEVSLPTALSLFALAPTPQAIAKLSVARIDALIHASAFHGAKARQIREIARRTVDEFGGELPCDAVVLTSFRGVGPKCATYRRSRVSMRRRWVMPRRARRRTALPTAPATQRCYCHRRRKRCVRL